MDKRHTNEGCLVYKALTSLVKKAALSREEIERQVAGNDEIEQQIKGVHNAPQESAEQNKPLPTALDLSQYIPSMVLEAQQAYDEWTQDDEGMDEVLGGGGICQDIAEKIATVLNLAGIEASTVSQQVGDQHVYVLAKLKDGVYEVDIPPRFYESGSGYVWKKKTGVVFDKSMIWVGKVSENPSDFEEMTGE